jgi:hypothetical protein
MERKGLLLFQVTMFEQALKEKIIHGRKTVIRRGKNKCRKAIAQEGQK